jgi:hypothetical protein
MYLEAYRDEPIKIGVVAFQIFQILMRNVWTALGIDDSVIVNLVQRLAKVSEKILNEMVRFFVVEYTDQVLKELKAHGLI